MWDELVLILTQQSNVLNSELVEASRELHGIPRLVNVLASKSEFVQCEAISIDSLTYAATLITPMRSQETLRSTIWRAVRWQTLLSRRLYSFRILCWSTHLHQSQSSYNVKLDCIGSMQHLRSFLFYGRNVEFQWIVTHPQLAIVSIVRYCQSQNLSIQNVSQ
jgi:hypothetical protein